MKTMRPLPIDEVLDEMQVALSQREACVLQAPPGAGKTTRVPLALLEAAWLCGQRILMLEPRRLAATASARYMAQQLGEEVGRTVGYTIRHESKVSPATRIEVVTEGILTRRLQGDPELTGVGLVILDEFHERSLNSDLALALCRDAQLGLRPDLRLLAMSATLDAAPLAALLDDCPLLTSAGRSYPVEVRYLGAPAATTPLAAAVATAIRRAIRETAGDMLVFLPGVGEILRCRTLLNDLATELELCVLYADLPIAEQERAILPRPGRRKVVLATNIAETSLTIEGVGVVIDSGFERRPRFDAARGMSLLETVRISRASSEQRTGRAGRLGPGVCYRLWGAGDEGSFLHFTPAEIRSADLAPLALELACWGVADVAALTWLDPPPAGHLAGARHLLRQLGALDGADRLTTVGAALARYPLHPRLARLLLAAEEAEDEALGADLAALLAERDILRREAPRREGSESDLLDRLAALARHRRQEGGAEIDARAAAAVQRTAAQLRRMQGKSSPPYRPAEVDAPRLARLLVPAWPDRIAKEREGGGGRYLLANGVGARLSPRTGVRAAPWLVVLELEGGDGGEGAIHRASLLEAKQLEELLGVTAVWQREVSWDERQGRIVAREVRRWGALPLAERPVAPQQDEIIAAFAQLLRRSGLALLTWTPEARQLLCRVRRATAVAPEEGWPDFSDERLLETLDAWLAADLSVCRSRADLARIDLVPPMEGLLSWPQRRRLDELLPQRIVVPSGSQLRVDYAVDGPPVLEVKLQELFGLAETPRVAAGRLPLMLHLLSPAQRPLAVTQDLRSFWDQVYPEVRKELRGRYPKHPWPDDPWSAAPTRHTTRRAGR